MKHTIEYENGVEIHIFQNNIKPGIKIRLDDGRTIEVESCETTGTGGEMRAWCKPKGVFYYNPLRDIQRIRMNCLSQELWGSIL